ncbi:MAG: hypothetical protein ACTH2U_11075 [Brevibacterium sp.]
MSSRLQDILAEPEDTRPLIEQAMDLLQDEDREAFEQALYSSQFPSSQLVVALATDAAVRDADKVPSVDNVTKWRKRKGIL